MTIKQDVSEAFDFNGLSIRDYTAGLDEKSSFAVIEVSPGVRHGLSRSNRSDKYYYVNAGRLTFQIEGRDYEFTKGDFCIIHQGETFDYSNDSGVSATLILVHTPNFILSEESFD
ncbi:MAG: cupin domain-containing protein [Spirochaetales bacterium]|nr:MAG: cupin domain-containing protein [Spirochaetales bacterium]